MFTHNLVRIGELRVYRAYMKEIVTSVDHVWGDIGKKYFSWMLSEKKLAMVFEFEIDFWRLVIVYFSNLLILLIGEVVLND